MTNPNETVNPQQNYDEFRDGAANYTCGGLTKREYFAAMAMQGMCAAVTNGQLIPTDRLVAWSVESADALIAELNKGVEQC